ncbi:MAG: amidohydrolase [Desulfobacteraceae bacterium]|nr:MAG: amidohydrolase [Desulfobacteraceae bacterium]
MKSLSTEKKAIAEEIQSRQKRFWEISDSIWGYAELGHEEFKSSALLADTLEEAGFSVKRGVAGMPTAFTAVWKNGAGKPVIGFLAEYDALPMLSQKPGTPEQDPIVNGAPGHGCGHNTMGAMQALTVVSLKAIMERHGISGTLKYYGSPAEEMLVSRPYMIRAGLFKGVDVVLDCHSHDKFSVRHGMEGLGMYSFTVSFRGKTSHSGASPWEGRSATDAVELLHAATERIREHLPTTQRTHWVTLEGGEAPNVVPDYARTWYFIRDLDDNLEPHFKWVLDCAKGAALMTQTTYEVKVLAAVHQRYGNRALSELMHENIKAAGKPKYTKEEIGFAQALQKHAGLKGNGMNYEIALQSADNTPLHGGSSDVGDVTLVAPTATLRFPTRVPGCHSHHWATTASSVTSMARKGITAGAKAAAFTACDLLTRPDELKKIRKEFAGLIKERPYRSFLPEGAEPPLGWNAALMEKYRAQLESWKG